MKPIRAPRKALDNEFRRKLLSGLLRARLVDEEIARRYVEQEMRCPVHLSIGQEAVAVGVCAALARTDYIMSTHRAHAHYLAKGGDLRAMLAEIYGKETGCSSGKGGSMHLLDLGANMLGSTPIVGGSIPVAVGIAFGAWITGKSRVTAVFFGEGATEEGVFLESLNFAALKKLPVVFVCENNLYSVYSPMSVRQPAGRDRAALAKAHGMDGVVGNGNDVEAVYRAAKEAAARARRGQGPSYLEFSTYRWREHCGPNYDNDIGYRTEAEFLAWKKKDPLAHYRSLLLKQGVVSEKWLSETQESIHREIEGAFTYAKASPFPSRDRLLSGVYAQGEDSEKAA